MINKAPEKLPEPCFIGNTALLRMCVYLCKILQKISINIVQNIDIKRQILYNYRILISNLCYFILPVGPSNPCINPVTSDEQISPPITRPR